MQYASMHIPYLTLFFDVSAILFKKPLVTITSGKNNGTFGVLYSEILFQIHYLLPDAVNRIFHYR